MPSETHKPKPPKPPKPDKVAIFIDGTKYQVEAEELSGAHIRAIAQPSIGDDRDLWLDIVDELDELIGDDQIVDLADKMRFFTVPRVINPGQQLAAGS